jgi:hypothetical protein
METLSLDFAAFTGARVHVWARKQVPFPSTDAQTAVT